MAHNFTRHAKYFSVFFYVMEDVSPHLNAHSLLPQTNKQKKGG